MVQQAASPTTADSSFILVYGRSPALRQRVVDQIVETSLPQEEREWGVVMLDVQDVGVDGFLAQLGSASLMADRRVVIVKAVEQLANAAQKQLASALGSVTTDDICVIDAQSSSDYRRKGPPVAADLRKVFEQRGQIIEAAAPSDRELPTWLAAEARSQGKEMPLPVARAAVEIAGADTENLLNELEKLVTYVGPQSAQISVADVHQVVTGENESSVFDLVDSIGRRDARSALLALPDLLPPTGSTGEAMRLLAMIARQLRLVWQAKALAAAGIDLTRTRETPPEWQPRLPRDHGFFETTKGRSFLVGKYVEQARSFSDVQLVRALVKVYETDLALKGQTDERMDDRMALETLIVALCRI